MIIWEVPRKTEGIISLVELKRCKTYIPELPGDVPTIRPQAALPPAALQWAEGPAAAAALPAAAATTAAAVPVI